MSLEVELISLDSLDSVDLFSLIGQQQLQFSLDFDRILP